MEKNICELCKTENEPEYKYCKNCGNELVHTEAAETKSTVNESEAGSFTPHVNNTAPPQPNYIGQAKNPQFFTVDNFDGVSAEEMAIFVGKNGHKILPKLSKMQLTGSKASWNWPAAILGYIFGPMGSALWFFYRKMYKPAVLLAVIGAIIMVITGAMSFGASNFDAQAILDSLSAGDIEGMMEVIEGAEASTTTAEKILATLSTLISEITNIAACVITGIYGFYIYKNHCRDKIAEYRAYQADQRFYKMGLASMGGQSGGMLALGIILMIAAESITTFVNGLLTLLF